MSDIVYVQCAPNATVNKGHERNSHLSYSAATRLRTRVTNYSQIANHKHKDLSRSHLLVSALISTRLMMMVLPVRPATALVSTVTPVIIKAAGNTLFRLVVPTCLSFHRVVEWSVHTRVTVTVMIISLTGDASVAAVGTVLTVVIGVSSAARSGALVFLVLLLFLLRFALAVFALLPPPLVFVSFVFLLFLFLDVLIVLVFLFVAIFGFGAFLPALC
jgi:hypothetical protein